MEKVDEIKGEGNSYTTEFREYDPRYARWLTIDPKTHHEYSPYSAFDNNPIYYVDPEGADSEGENKPDLNEKSAEVHTPKETEANNPNKLEANPPTNQQKNLEVAMSKPNNTIYPNDKEQASKLFSSQFDGYKKVEKISGDENKATFKLYHGEALINENKDVKTSLLVVEKVEIIKYGEKVQALKLSFEKTGFIEATKAQLFLGQIGARYKTIYVVGSRAYSKEKDPNNSKTTYKWRFDLNK